MNQKGFTLVEVLVVIAIIGLIIQNVERSLKEIQGQLKLFEDDDAESLLGQLLRELEKEDGCK